MKKGPFKMKGFSGFGNSPAKKNTKKTTHPMEAIKKVDMTKNMSESEKEKYLARLRGDYMDLTGDKLKKASHGDPSGTIVSKDPKGPITGN